MSNNDCNTTIYTEQLVDKVGEGGVAPASYTYGQMLAACVCK